MPFDALSPFRLPAALFLASFASLAAQTASPFASGAWCGNVTPTTATVSVRLNAPALAVRLAVSTNDRLSPAAFSPRQTTAAASGNVAILDIEGLQPSTDYFYGVEVAGVLRTETISRGKFRTFPLGAASFRLAFASCGDYRDPDQRAYSAIAGEQPLLFVHMGDFHYSDINSTAIDDYRRNFDNILNHPVQGGLYRSLALAYMWDDHDFQGDNTNGSSPGTATVRQAYREAVPHYPITVTGGTIAQSFTVGRVRVIMTDLRSASSAQDAPETVNKTRLGSAQKTWFKQELISARDAGFPLILWVSTVPWIAPPLLGDDTWGGYATERIELATFIRDNRIKNVVLLSGDMHALAYDDGTNSDYSIGGGAPLVVLHAAPLTRPGDIKGGPYIGGPLFGTLQYGVLDITDTGGPSIQVHYSGKRVGEGTKLGLQFTASTAGIVTATGPNAGDRAFVNISTRGRITTAGEAVIAGFVIGGTESRNILVRAVGPSLTAFGVTDAVLRPVITVYRGTTAVAINSNWTALDQARLVDAFDRVGAFRLSTTSPNPDAALLLSLPPGPYTIQATGQNGATGTVLLEAYDVP